MATTTALYRSKPRLKATLSGLPPAPGIYRFYDVNDSIIYVGKSVCLRDRVRSYFTGKAPDKKVRRLRQEVVRLDWDETGSELEALLLESRLVKSHLPRFNVMLREFVPLPYVRIDARDPFPRLEVTRSPACDGARYYGPFRSQNALEAAVDALTHSFRLRDCPESGERLLARRPCYRMELGTCSAPCAGGVSPAEYQDAVASACGAFDGQGEATLAALHQRMERAAERLQFELAARLRDASRHIQAIAGRQQALVSATTELSLVAACPSRRESVLSLFVFRGGRLVLQEEVEAETLRQSAARKAWARRLHKTARAPVEEPRKTTIDPALLDEIQIVTAWMKQKTRQGDYWQIPHEKSSPQQVASLDRWLAHFAVESEDCLAA
jgi:DNA polymerase III subunit epsilon